MKELPIALSFLTNPARRRDFYVLGKLLLLFVVIVVVYTILFHVIMLREGQRHSWLTGLYWTLVVMSTLGFGDITFQSDLGRVFSVVVLLTGTVYMLVLLPFMFIQFFYVPWMESQAAARAPRELPTTLRGHVVLTRLGAVEQSLIRLLKRSHIPYVLLVPDLTEALRLHDEGYRVMLGGLDDPQTYINCRASQAAMVFASQKDTTNTNIAFTVREISESVTIVATATAAASVDILELAGCNRVLQFGEMLGSAMARRVLGRDAKAHTVGAFGELQIAEASAAGTPLAGRTLQAIRLRDHVNLNVIGVWDRGQFRLAGPDTLIQPSTVLMLAGQREQLEAYNGLFCIYTHSDAPVVIIGGGRVGRAIARTLREQEIDYRIIEKLPERVRDKERTVLGDAAELEVLQQAGIMESASVAITSHDDDINVYLTIYCRRLRKDIQIIARANEERNISTLHRAGADFVMSYASSGANVIYNLLNRGSILLLAEGLDVFRISTPSNLAGKSLAQSSIRQRTGCNVVAVVEGERTHVNPDAHSALPADSELILIGDEEAEARFFQEFGGH